MMLQWLRDVCSKPSRSATTYAEARIELTEQLMKLRQQTEQVRQGRPAGLSAEVLDLLRRELESSQCGKP